MAKVMIPPSPIVERPAPNITLILEIEKSNATAIKVFESNNKQLNDILIEQEQGKKLWKFCVILALLFLATEIALLRLMKG